MESRNQSKRKEEGIIPYYRITGKDPQNIDFDKVKKQRKIGKNCVCQKSVLEAIIEVFYYVENWLTEGGFKLLPYFQLVVKSVQAQAKGKIVEIYLWRKDQQPKHNISGPTNRESYAIVEMLKTMWRVMNSVLNMTDNSESQLEHSFQIVLGSIAKMPNGEPELQIKTFRSVAVRLQSSQLFCCKDKLSMCIRNFPLGMATLTEANQVLWSVNANTDLKQFYAINQKYRNLALYVFDYVEYTMNAGNRIFRRQENPQRQEEEKTKYLSNIFKQILEQAEVTTRLLPQDFSQFCRQTFQGYSKMHETLSLERHIVDFFRNVLGMEQDQKWKSPHEFCLKFMSSTTASSKNKTEHRSTFIVTHQQLTPKRFCISLVLETDLAVNQDNRDFMNCRIHQVSHLVNLFFQDTTFEKSTCLCVRQYVKLEESEPVLENLMRMVLRLTMVYICLRPYHPQDGDSSSSQDQTKLKSDLETCLRYLRQKVEPQYFNNEYAKVCRKTTAY